VLPKRATLVFFLSGTFWRGFPRSLWSLCHSLVFAVPRVLALLRCSASFIEKRGVPLL